MAAVCGGYWRDDSVDPRKDKPEVMIKSLNRAISEGRMMQAEDLPKHIKERVFRILVDVCGYEIVESEPDSVK